MIISGNKLQKVVELLKGRLPPGWRVTLGRTGADLILTAPDRRRGKLTIQYRERLEPRDVALVASARAKGTTPLVASRYLSKSTQERLREAQLSYADLTGNLWLSLGTPGLFIEALGATKDPDRKARPARTLRGPRAGRVVRVLCDFQPPIGVRELAGRAGVDPGYTSRVVKLLSREALVRRNPRGPVVEVDWERLLRRWAQDAPLGSRGVQQSFIEPRGLQSMVERLRSFNDMYAITGSLAASRLAAIAPPRLAMLYVEKIEHAAKALTLLPAESGSNVVLIEPVDGIVFERTQTSDGLIFAAPSQVFADLVDSPGRGPAEAEALITWMRENQEAWCG